MFVVMMIVVIFFVFFGRGCVEFDLSGVIVVIVG